MMRHHSHRIHPMSSGSVSLRVAVLPRSFDEGVARPAPSGRFFKGVLISAALSIPAWGIMALGAGAAWQALH